MMSLSLVGPKLFRKRPHCRIVQLTKSTTSRLVKQIDRINMTVSESLNGLPAKLYSIMGYEFKARAVKGISELSERVRAIVELEREVAATASPVGVQMGA